jgi:hypothetical protein
LFSAEGNQDIMHIAELVSFNCVSDFSKWGQLQKGAAGARSDDTKSLKGSVIDWITPDGQTLHPPLSRTLKMDRGFQHEVTGRFLCPVGLDWNDGECVVSSTFSRQVTIQLIRIK